LQSLNELVILDETGGGLVKFCDRQSSSLFDIRIVVSETVFERFAQVLRDAFNANAAHGSDGKGAHEWVGSLFGVFLKGVDGHDGEVGFAFGVVDDVKVDKLFQLNACRLHAFDHVGEERRNVFADGHHCNDLFDGLLSLVLLV